MTSPSYDQLRNQGAGTMSAYRFEIEALAGPARRGRVGGGGVAARPRAHVRRSGVVDTWTGEPAGQPDAFTDLDPHARAQARVRCCSPPRSTPSSEPASELLGAAR